MKNTKDVHTRNTKKITLRICALVFMTFLYCGISGHLIFSEAALLTVRNHVTNDSYIYSGSNVQYEINGTNVPTDFPGLILSNGAAVGPYKELFEDVLGVTSDYTPGKDNFSISYGPHTIKMTLGNTEAIVNGQKQIMNNAPFVYSFNNSSDTYLYVPTRFVTETLGFTYTWNSATATVSIQRTNIIYDGTNAVSYTGNIPYFSLNGKLVTSDTYPGYYFDNTALFDAKEYFQNSGMAVFTYREGSGLIVLKNSACTVRLVVDSPIAYINEKGYLLDTVPRLITPQGSSTPGVYVPARFVAEALGYTVYYHKANDTLRITGDVPVLSPDSSQQPDTPSTSGHIVTDTASYGSVLFSYDTHEQILAHYSEQGYRVPKALSAYSCVNSDALYIKGVTENDIHITDKADVIEITIRDHRYPNTGRLSYNPDATYLNYCYISSTDTVKLLVFKSKDLHYYSYSAPDGCVIHFTDTDGLFQDRLSFVVYDSEQETESDSTNIFGKDESSEELPEAIFTREHFVIRLPEGVTSRDIKDFDDYPNKRFTVSVPGNHIEFLSEQDTYNPVRTLNDIRFSHRVTDNTTVITFSTTKIQGYSLTIADGFLAVRIADPKEIYDKIIVLDAGHGGIDPGTLRGTVYEKNVNYNVINVYAPEYFKDSDIKVYHTRTTDTKIALQNRADFAASVGADLFISFHVNAHSNSAVNGTSVYYSASNNKASSSGLKSSVLAQAVTDCLSKAWGTKNRGILTDKFVVIHNNTVPAVLVECGFITNNNDFEKIKDTTYQKKAAKALFDAVTEIFEKYPTKR